MEIRLSALLRSMDLSEDEGRRLLEEAWAKHDEAWKQVETFGPGRMAAYCLEAKGIFDDDRIAALTEEFELASTTSGVEAVEELATPSRRCATKTSGSASCATPASRRAA